MSSKKKRKETKEGIPTSCPTGFILRKGYHRKGYERKGYTRTSGSYVGPAEVHESNVPAICIKKRGKHGLGPRILPRLDTLIHLKDYGYSTHKSDSERHKALLDAAKETDLLLVLRRLNLIRNYQTNADAKKIMGQDVKFLEGQYHSFRARHGKSRRSYAQRELERKGNMRGGQEGEVNESDIESIEGYGEPEEEEEGEEEEEVKEEEEEGEEEEKEEEYLETGEQEGTEEMEEITLTKTCDESGCKINSNIREKHTIRQNGKEYQLLYYTLSEDDAQELTDLANNICRENITEEEIRNLLNNNKGFFVGLKVTNGTYNNKLVAYCQYDIYPKSKEAEFVSFCAESSFGSALEGFMEKYLQKIGFTHLITKPAQQDRNFKRNYDLFVKRGFKLNHQQMILTKNI
jgi:hypothetical protein